MGNFKDLVEFRTRKLAGTEDDRWLWPRKDKGAYAGPFTDWDNSHIHKYFNSVKKFDTVVTAGANMGLHCRHYATRFNHVYAFEPQWINFYCLSYNTPYNNVYKFNCALGKTCGMVKIPSEPITNMGSYRVDRKSNPDNSNIPMLSIDSLNLNSCDLIQLDVEGFEGDILEGARATIKKFKPVIIVENVRPETTKVIEDFKYVLQEKSVSDQIYYVK